MNQDHPHAAPACALQRNRLPARAGRCLVVVAFLVTGLYSMCAVAHLSSGSYLRLTLEGDSLVGQWDIALRDLDVAIGLDTDGDGAITWGEVRARQHDIAAYALSRLRLTSGKGDCTLRVTQQLVDHHADGGYAVLRLAATCPPQSRVLTLNYRLLFDLDPTHSGLLTITDNGHASTAVLNAQRMSYIIVPGAAETTGFFSFLLLGVAHILGGRDHLLFLAVLLAPALAAARRAGLVASLRDAAGLLSLFTAAHAVTVTLAALSIIEVPGRISEAAIAFSIAMTAADNIWHFLGPRRGVIAFGFGLIHGLGFASALGPLALRGWALIAALVGFNTGIEAVQLALASIGFAVVFLVPRPGLRLPAQRWLPAVPRLSYANHASSAPATVSPLLFPLCSLLILCVSAYWFAERSFLLVTQP